MLHASEVGRTLRTLLLVAAFALVPQLAWAQFPSNVASVNLSASLTESLSVSAGTGPVTFTLVPNGIASGSAPVAMQTSWVLRPSRGTVTLVGYFDSVDAMTDGGSATINVATVQGRVTTGTPTSFTAFTQTPTVGIGTAGASLVLFSETIIGNNKEKSRTDNLELQINLTGPVQQPAGTYTGILRIQAVAI